MSTELNAVTLQSIEKLAALIQVQTRKTRQNDRIKTFVRPGRSFTKIDRGEPEHESGYLMVEHDSGVIYGIKGYGRVHRGHCYGTLGNMDLWYWGEYDPLRYNE